MVDNGKYSISFHPKSFASFITKLESVANIDKMVDFKHYKIYRLYLYNNVISLDKEHTFGKPCLEINLKYWYGKVTIEITNSIRKWFYGACSLRDFNLTDLTSCFKLMSKMLSIPFKLFLKAKVYNLEVGFNLRFDRNFSSFLLTVIEHRNLKNKNIIGLGTREFEGENLKIIFYDKLREMYDHDTISKRTYEKISERYFYLRVEVDFTKVSGVEFAKAHLRTIKDLLNNFPEIYHYVVKQVRQVTLIDWISPRISEEIETSDNKVFFNWLVSIGIDQIGLDNLFMMADRSLATPWRVKNKLRVTAESFRSLKRPSYRTLLFDSLIRCEKIIMQ